MKQDSYPEFYSDIVEVYGFKSCCTEEHGYDPLTYVKTVSQREYIEVFANPDTPEIRLSKVYEGTHKRTWKCYYNGSIPTKEFFESLISNSELKYFLHEN